jgi:hypothetical protein
MPLYVIVICFLCVLCRSEKKYFQFIHFISFHSEALILFFSFMTLWPYPADAQIGKNTENAHILPVQLTWTHWTIPGTVPMCGCVLLINFLWYEIASQCCQRIWTIFCQINQKFGRSRKNSALHNFYLKGVKLLFFYVIFYNATRTYKKKINYNIGRGIQCVLQKIYHAV